MNDGIHDTSGENILVQISIPSLVRTSTIKGDVTKNILRLLKLILSSHVNTFAQFFFDIILAQIIVNINL
jgi:hypothetical protein